jgi:hypothetical protein
LFSGIGGGSGDGFNRSNDSFKTCIKVRDSAGLGFSVTTFGVGFRMGGWGGERGGTSARIGS